MKAVFTYAIAFLLAIAVEASPIQTGMEFEELVEKSQIIVLVPVSEMELQGVGGVQVTRMSIRDEMPVYYKGGPLLHGFNVRLLGPGSVEPGRKIVIKESEKRWGLFFLGLFKDGAYNVISGNEYQSGSFFRFEETRPPENLIALLGAALQSTDYNSRRNAFGIIDRTEDPAILGLLERLRATADSRDVNRIDNLLRGAKEMAERKSYVFSDEAAQKHFATLFEQWKQAWSTSNWAALVALLHSEDSDVKDWNKGGAEKKELTERWQKKRARGPIMSSEAGNLFTYKDSAQQHYLCTAVGGKQIEWVATIKPDRNGLVKLLDFSLFDQKSPPSPRN